MGSAREHKNLKNKIRLALGRRGDIRLFNNESGLAVYETHKVRYGVGKGGSDLIGMVCMPVEMGGSEFSFARFIALEVKTGDAKPDKDQILFMEQVRRYGGFACVVRSVRDAVDAVARCREGAYQ